MAVWFTSDPHYGHKNLITKHSFRHFTSVEEMNSELVRRWNALVKPTDTCFVLGDFSMAKWAVREFAPQLQGTKILVAGNHDHVHGKTPEVRNRRAQLYYDVGFAMVLDEFQLPVKVQSEDGELEHFRFLLSHYPPTGDTTGEDRFLERRPRVPEGMILIHGHTHSRERVNAGAIHVGVDAWDFAPASMAEIVDLARTIKREGG